MSKSSEESPTNRYESLESRIESPIHIIQSTPSNPPSLQNNKSFKSLLLINLNDSLIDYCL